MSQSTSAPHLGMIGRFLLKLATIFLGWFVKLMPLSLRRTGLGESILQAYAELKKVLAPEVEFQMLVCVVQCFRCLDAVPIVATMKVDTKTLGCKVERTLGKHCDWFWTIHDKQIVARNLSGPARVEIGNDASTPEERQLWIRASRNL